MPSSDVIGSWQLLYIETTDETGRVVNNANELRGRGSRPAGMVTYTKSGHMAVQIVPTDRKPYIGTNPTYEEAKALFNGFTAYFGTFTVDAESGTVYHHMVSHTDPRLAGTTYTRFFEVSGDQLVLRLPEKVEGPHKQTQRLYWKRLD